jgi:hypothetical protein
MKPIYLKCLRTFQAGAAAAAMLLGVVGPASAATSGGQSAMFTNTNYDYGASVIDSGSTRQIWWCGNGTVPGTSYSSDVIYYRTQNKSTGAYTSIQKVFTPNASSSAWDHSYVCDPSVIAGSFTDASTSLTYTLAMYYSGTDRGPGSSYSGTAQDGTNNRIGVAYSNDGVTWVRQGTAPVITPSSYPTDTYGAGQPATYNSGTGAAVQVFYTDTSSALGARVFTATTSNGVSFSSGSAITNQGLGSGNTGATTAMADIDMIYDAGGSYWYAAVPTDGRSGDREVYPIGLFRIAASTLSSGAWESLGWVNTNQTGAYLNNNVAFGGRDGQGRLASTSSIELIYGAGTNTPSTWDLRSATVSPSTNAAFTRYFTGSNDHWVTTGYIAGGYSSEGVLGYLLPARQSGAHALYGCQISGATDHFISLYGTCEGQLTLGVNGWAYDSSQTNTRPIWRCFTGVEHFVSLLSTCEGYTTEDFLGYIINP